MVGSQKEYAPCYKQGVFDKYRSLASALYPLGVSDNKSSKFVISAPFPRTYQRSSMGIALTPEQLNDRCRRLHEWVVALLEMYSTLPEAAQTEICKFFHIEPDNPEPQGKAIVSILSADWMSENVETRDALRNSVLKIPEPVSPVASNGSAEGTRGTSGGVLNFIDIGEGSSPNSCCVIS